MKVAPRLAVGASALALVLSGCSDSQAGQAVPDPSAGQVSSSEPDDPTHTTAPSSSPTQISPLDSIQPCSLLSNSDRSSLGLADGERKDVGRSRGCDWQQSGKWTASIGLWGQLAFKDANLRGATPHPVEVGRHEAYRVENPGGGTGGICDVFLITSQSSFVQVIAVIATNDTAKACDYAVSVAKIVDPKLP